jgi:hypothetical protein
MFNLMSYDAAIQKALNETGGDLSKSNSISRLAEEVGILIRNVTGDPTCLPNALRDPAVEKFNYVNPATLKEDAPNNMLAAECHSFGRVFSGAWYEIFLRLYNHHKSLPGTTPLAAVKTARDAAFSMLVAAVPLSARVTNYYSAIARSMTNVAKTKSIHYEKIVSDVFDERNILKKNGIKILSSISLKDVAKTQEVQKVGKMSIVNLADSKTFKVSELPLVSSMSDKGDLEIEVPFGSSYEFDSRGRLVYEMLSDADSAKESAAMCLLNIGDNIGDQKMWKIENGKLVRNFIS